MKNRVAILFVVLLVTSSMPFPTAMAQNGQGTVDDIVEDPVDRTTDSATWASGDATESSIVRVFQEDWEGVDSIGAAGWHEEVVAEGHDPQFQHVHKEKDKPGNTFVSPISTHSGKHAVTMMNDEATYKGLIDTRLVSPTIDLRYVRGGSQDTTALHGNEEVAGFLQDLEDSYLAAVGAGPGATSGPLSTYHYLFTTPPSQWTPVPCPGDTGVNVVRPCTEVAKRAGFERDATESTGTGSVDPGNFFFLGFFLDMLEGQVPTSAPSTRPDDQGVDVSEDGRVYAPSPLDDREGVSYVNLTFFHEFDLADSSGNDSVYLEVRERRDDGSWGPWRYLQRDEVFNNPAGHPSTTTHEATTGQRTMSYNGHAGGADYKPAFVKSSGDIVASTFNLNRFAGSEVQVAFHVDGINPNPSTTGWFLDDVVVWASTYPRDAAVQRVHAPQEMDRVAVGETFQPNATVRNFGYRAMENISVSFRVTPANDTSVVLERSSEFIRHLAPQEAVRVTSPEAFQLDEVGDYDLVVNLTTYGAPTDPLDDNLTAMPETSPVDQNDEVVVPFQVEDVPRAHVTVQMDPDSIQTNVGEPKRFDVSVENTGNVPLGGQVQVTLQRLDRDTLSPVGEPRVLAVDTIRARDLPYGRNLTVLGSEDNTWTKAYEWSQGVDQPGVYRVSATFVTDAGSFDGNRSTFVRATPLPYLQEDMDQPLNLPFHRSSVFDHGFDSSAYQTTGNGIERVNPDPVSRNHVLAATGSDGGVGVATWGNATLNGTGLEDTVTNNTLSYDELAVVASQYGNTMDHYWLVRDVDLTNVSSAERVLLRFWHSGSFQWAGQAAADQASPERSRGLVEVLPQRNVPLTDPAGDVRSEAPNASTPESGVAPVDDRAPDGGVNTTNRFPLFGRTVASYEDSFSWKKSTVDLTPWRGQKITLRFHLETTAARGKSSSFDPASGTTTEDQRALDDWLVDNVALEARWSDNRKRVLFQDDVEGASASGWSMNRGLTFGDEDRPLAFLEGRGWTRFAYEKPFPTGWHVVSEPRPQAGVEVPSPMLYWGEGDPDTTGQPPQGLDLSVLRTPTFSLADARNPALRILHNYTFDFGDPGADYSENGGSVWIVGEDANGDEVVRDLLVPEDGYDATIRSVYSVRNSYCPGDPDATENEDSHDHTNRLHCDTVMRQYEDEPNVFTNRSGLDPEDRGRSRWVRSVFDLAQYAQEENRSLRYHVEFHAIHQGEPSAEEWGWLVDDVQITESTFANDMAVNRLVQPAGSLTVGPGLQVPVAVHLQNLGLYDQVGAEVRYRVLDNEGKVVGEPVVEHLDPGRLVPGTLNQDNPDRNITHIFSRPWTTPTQEGTYTLEVASNLSGALPGHAYPDDNPSNDVLRTRVDVVSARSVSLLSSEGFGDRASIDPFLGSTQELRTLRAKVQNLGTLPEVFTEARGNAGEFHVNVTVANSNGDVVFQSTAPIRKLSPSEEKVVSFRNAWRPSTSGEYRVSFTLNHPNETVPGSMGDNERVITYRVFERFVPQPGETLQGILQPQAGGWEYTEDGWRFGDGTSYPPRSMSVLELKDPLNLLALRNALLTVNHTYGFEPGYDGALLEVSVDDGRSWHPVPLVRNESATGDDRVGYPVNATLGSPMRGNLSHVNNMLSGTSGGGDEPQPVTDIFDLGAVPELVSEDVTIFDDGLYNATDAEERSQDARRGVWNHGPVTDVDNGDLGYSIVRPHSGSKMWHSNRSVAMNSDCWRVKSENTTDSRGGSLCSPPDKEDPPVQTAKFLNLTLDGQNELPNLGDVIARDDTAGVRISFWDYRLVGGVNSDVDPRPTVPNEVEAYLVCMSCEDRPRKVLNRLAASGYDNSYRGWTKNVYTVDKAELVGWEGEKVRLSLVHHTTVDPNGQTRWATDSMSTHMGWFVDDVAVSAVEGNGAVRTLWASDLEDLSRTFIHNATNASDTWYAEKQDTGPWTGSWRSSEPGTELEPRGDRLLWDVRSGYGEPIWNFRNDSKKECSDTDVACSNENVEDDHMWVARGPNGSHVERAGGSRLVTPLNLRSSVGDVTLSFWHRYRFHEFEGGVSGGLVEASVDGGQTWIPLEPKTDADRTMYNRSEDPVTSAHSTLTGRDGDPEGDSIYGINTHAFTGQGYKTWEKVSYDLSRFAGREVQLSFHAFFGTYFKNDAVQSIPWFWAIDDLRVTSDVLDGQYAQLRLRAGTDATESREGWTVHDLQLTGIKHNVNGAVRVLGVDGSARIPAGEPVPFQVRVENRGEVPQGPTTFDVDVKVTNDQGRVSSWENITVELGPESTTTLSAQGDRAFEFTPKADTSYSIHASVRIVDPALGSQETILRDNTRTVHIPQDLVMEGSTLTLPRVTVLPNHLERGTEPVNVDVTVRNQGFKTRDLQYLNLSLTPKGAQDPVLHLTRSDLADSPGTRFDGAFESKTYRWVLSPSKLEDLDGGLYDLQVLVKQLQGGDTSTVTKPLYLGSDYISEYANVQRVSNQTDLQDDQGWESSSYANPSQGIEYSYPWTLSTENRSRYQSFSLPPGVPVTSGSTGGSRSGGNPQHGRTWLLSPKIPVSELGSRNVAVTFFTQYEVQGNASLQIAYEYLLDGSDDACLADKVSAGGKITGSNPGTAGYIRAADDPHLTSDGFALKRWAHESVPIPPAPEDATHLCIAFYGRAPHSDDSNPEISTWRIDDVVLAPYSVDMGPDIQAPVRDDMVKTYRFQLTNEGAYNDTYRFEYVDASGSPVDIPPSWNLRVLTPQGDELQRLAMAAGETRELLLEVHVPVQQASGTSGIADLAVTAVSETNPIVRETMNVDLSFDYPPRPNLVVLDLRVNDADLPAGEPRSVVATVANMGDAPARNAPLSVVDTMPPEFGVAPVQLTRLDGEPLRNLSLMPGDVVSVLAQWTPRASGPHNVTLALDPDDIVVESVENDNEETKRVVLDAARFPDLHVEVDVSDDEPQVGDPVQVNATITNRGNARATGVQVSFRVGVADLLDGTPPHILPQPIEPGESVHLTSTWPAPFPGTYRVFARAFPLSGALERVETEEDNLRIRTMQVRSRGLAMDGPHDPVPVQVGSIATAGIELSNRGEARDVVSLLVDAPQGLRAHLEQDGVTVARVALDNGTSTNLTLHVRSPARIAAGTYPVTVEARSLNTSQVETHVVPLRVEPTHGVKVEGRAVNLDTGTRSVPVHLENTGNSPATVSWSIPDLPATWRLGAEAVELKPYEERSVNVTLRIPTSTDAGVVDLTLEAATDHARDTAPVRVNVQEREVVNVTMEPREVHLRPGTSTTLNVTLHNVGNAPAYAALGSVVPAGWSTDLPRPRARLQPDEEIQIALPVHVPADAEAGTYQATLEARSGDQVFQGVTLVHVGVPDLTVAHIQQTPRVNVEAGETVRFNVSLRNVGTLASDGVPVGMYVDDELVAYRTLNAVGAGQGTSVEFTWSAASGEHVVLVVVDPGEDIVEEDEGNNAHLRVVGAGSDVSVFTGAQRAVPLPAGWAFIALVAAALCLRRRWTS